MIYTNLISHLQKLDDLENEYYRSNPLALHVIDHKQRDFLGNIKEQQKYIVLQMAKSLGLKLCECKNGLRER